MLNVSGFPEITSIESGPGVEPPSDDLASFVACSLDRVNETLIELPGSTLTKQPNSHIDSTPLAETMFGRPQCPNCGSRFLVVRVPTVTSGALHRPNTSSHRCYRCFTKFRPDSEPSDDGFERDIPESKSPPIVGRSTVEIVDTTLVLTERGTKLAVEEFAVTVRNVADEPVEVTQVLLTFDGAEEKAAPRDGVVVPPKGTETIDIQWNWIHPDQNDVTIEVRSGGRTLASTDTQITGSR